MSEGSVRFKIRAPRIHKWHMYMTPYDLSGGDTEMWLEWGPTIAMLSHHGVTTAHEELI